MWWMYDKLWKHKLYILLTTYKAVFMRQELESFLCRNLVQTNGKISVFVVLSTEIGLIHFTFPAEIRVAGW